MNISKEVVAQPKPLTLEQMKGVKGGTATDGTETTYIVVEDLVGI